jgi:hypothetical protein
LESNRLVIQGLPSLTDASIIPIGIEAKEAGEFIFSINHLDGFDLETQIFLYDTETESLIDLRAGNYTVSLEKGEFNERFSLRVTPNRVSSLGDLKQDIGIKAYAYKNQIIIQFANTESAKSEIAIYDLMGRMLVNTSNENQLNRKLSIQQTGVFIIRVSNRFGSKAQKIFIY